MSWGQSPSLIAKEKGREGPRVGPGLKTWFTLLTHIGFTGR